jgi:hypothetical protein
VRIVLAELSEKLNQALKDEAQLSTAVTRLSKGRTSSAEMPTKETK